VALGSPSKHPLSPLFPHCALDSLQLEVGGHCGHPIAGVAAAGIDETLAALEQAVGLGGH
jgi:hypothetical protein